MYCGYRKKTTCILYCGQLTQVESQKKTTGRHNNNNKNNKLTKQLSTNESIKDILGFINQSTTGKLSPS